MTVPAIVDEETFLRSRQRHAENQRFSPRNLKGDERWLLRGLVRCGLCGHAVITLRTPRGYAGKGFNDYYRCRHTHETLTPCKAPYMRAQALDNLVWEEVCRLLTNPAVLRQSIMDGAIASESSAMVHSQKATLERQLSAAFREKTRLMDAYQAGLIELPDLQTRLSRLEVRLTQLEQESKRLTQLQQEADAEEDLLRRLDSLSERIRRQLDNLSFTGRQTLLREVLDHVAANPDQVSLYFAIPLPPTDPKSPPKSNVSSELHLREDGRGAVSLLEKPIPRWAHLLTSTRASSG
ncbi:MAG: recombinase zinc beta ribbon domain-containing protein, partial [Alicyclobacillus sp.]|nr:recombinase zinc beta ribbon domain-containing protein [Alicyclobacillus sp.]